MRQISQTWAVYNSRVLVRCGLRVPSLVLAMEPCSGEELLGLRAAVWAPLPSSPGRGTAGEGAVAECGFPMSLCLLFRGQPLGPGQLSQWPAGPVLLLELGHHRGYAAVSARGQAVSLPLTGAVLFGHHGQASLPAAEPEACWPAEEGDTPSLS